MIGKQRIEAAFSEKGTAEIPVVICYEGIYIRDHWSQLTSCPWWYQHSTEMDQQLAWRREVIAKTGQDWFNLPVWYSKKEREDTFIEVRSEGVFRIDRRNGKEERLEEPQVGGQHMYGRVISMPETVEDVIRDLPPLPGLDSGDIASDEKADLAEQLLKDVGNSIFPVQSVGSPLWSCFSLWKFEDVMINISENPELIKFACRHFLEIRRHMVREYASIGTKAIWIEECMTDMISPGSFAFLNIPFVKQLVEEIHSLGMKSIYYYCGNPEGKWDHILSVGADAISLEESKKNFSIDIEEVVDRVNGKCTVLGNLDSFHVLQDGTDEELRAEISRQVKAGRKNGSRFIMSLGSPVTPGTPVDRVQLYCDLVHEIGNS